MQLQAGVKRPRRRSDPSSSAPNLITNNGPVRPQTEPVFTCITPPSEPKADPFSSSALGLFNMIPAVQDKSFCLSPAVVAPTYHLPDEFPSTSLPAQDAWSFASTSRAPSFLYPSSRSHNEHTPAASMFEVPLLPETNGKKPAQSASVLEFQRDEYRFSRAISVGAYLAGACLGAPETALKLVQRVERARSASTERRETRRALKRQSSLAQIEVQYSSLAARDWSLNASSSSLTSQCQATGDSTPSVAEQEVDGRQLLRREEEASGGVHVARPAGR